MHALAAAIGLFVLAFNCALPCVAMIGGSRLFRGKGPQTLPLLSCCQCGRYFYPSDDHCCEDAVGEHYVGADAA